jgi:hypothetical protein
MGMYVLYLMPYVAVSYYERYAAPLLGIKILLILWAGDRLLCLWPWWPWRAQEEAITAVEGSEAVEALPVEEEEAPRPARPVARTPVKKAVKPKSGEKP